MMYLSPSCLGFVINYNLNLLNSFECNTCKYVWLVNMAGSVCVFADEVDILGYGSSTSDTDDHSSIQSNSSDGGCAVTTRRLLTLSESL